jgi:hypothetical protein
LLLATQSSHSTASPPAALRAFWKAARAPALFVLDLGSFTAIRPKPDTAFHKIAKWPALARGRKMEDRMDLGLEGKIVLVTGAASGMGRAIAHGFAAHRARVFAVDRNADELGETVREGAGLGGEIVPHVAEARRRRPSSMRRRPASGELTCSSTMRASWTSSRASTNSMTMSGNGTWR